MTNVERDALLLKISNKIFNGFDQAINRLDRDVAAIRKMLWGLLGGSVILFVGIVVDILIHMFPRELP